MRILVVGSGGREHAILKALARSTEGPELICSPGNAGTSDLAENVAVQVDDVDGLVSLARSRHVGLVVVGPEVPLVLGLADRLAEVGIPVVGPSAAAARLEGSKEYAKEVMARYGVPTAASRSFGRARRDAARAYVESHPLPVVLKADGLAAGKGVIVAMTRDEAREGLESLFDDDAFSDAGATVLVEAFLEGEEASVFVLTDGTDFAILAPAQDHKRIGEGDTGPNTGGMGAYAPAPIVTPEVLARAESDIIRPILNGMRAEGHPYQGILYVGLMIGSDGPNVVEFNCRLGDPEAQVVLPLLESDAVELLLAVATGRLSAVKVRSRDGYAACVVLASAGYPGSYETGKLIQIGETGDAQVFHAGTARTADGQVVTAGGRVLGVTGMGSGLQEALDVAYSGARAVSFDGKTLRRDIGQKGLASTATALVDS